MFLYSKKIMNQSPLKKKLKKKSMGLNSGFFHLTSTGTPFKQMNFIRNGNKRSSIDSKNKGIAVIKYQEYISTLVFGKLMKKNQKFNSSDLFETP
jgi:hypothetical protein